MVCGHRSLDSKPGETVAATVPEHNVPVSIECDCRQLGGNSGAIVKADRSVVGFSTRLFYDAGVGEKWDSQNYRGSGRLLNRIHETA